VCASSFGCECLWEFLLAAAVACLWRQLDDWSELCVEVCCPHAPDKGRPPVFPVFFLLMGMSLVLSSSAKSDPSLKSCLRVCFGCSDHRQARKYAVIQRPSETKAPSARPNRSPPSLLQSYASILYLALPPGFRMFLRGHEIQHHRLTDDLRFAKEMMYRPHMDEAREVS
jgi:hypothetical protein